MDAKTTTSELYDYTKEEILEVPCFKCRAKEGERCHSIPGQRSSPILIGFHVERLQLRKKIPVISGDIPTNVTADQKSLITYYAYIWLCDSVAANSVAVLGKKMSSQAIQRFFAAKSVRQLRIEGFIK